MPHASGPIDTAILAMLDAKADAQGRLSFADFMEVVLYTPQVGYYRRPKKRVGRDPEADFYTSMGFRELFRDLIITASQTIWGEETCAKLTFVEVGAEPGNGLLDNGSHPFADHRVLRLGDPIEIPPNALLFSNELFDAQPFHRLIRHHGVWREQGVCLQENTLRETLLPEWSPTLAEAFPPRNLPTSAPEGYRIDLPIASRKLLRDLLQPPWNGAFLAFDYGKPWEALSHDHPLGTARGYRHHRQVANLLESPGKIDLTCDVCWDWLVEDLLHAGFQNVEVERQERFFVTNVLAKWLANPDNCGRRDPATLHRLQELIHPERMGHRFQAIIADRFTQL